MAESNKIPEKADQLLFAEDLVSHVISRGTRVRYERYTAEHFREFIYNGYTETIGAAVNYLIRKIERDDNIFQFMRHLCNKNKELMKTSCNGITFMNIVEVIGQKYFLHGFDVNNFLPFCVHIATVATHFYRTGIEEVPALAILYIMGTFQNIDTTAGGWDTLRLIAEGYESMSNCSMKRNVPEDF